MTRKIIVALGPDGLWNVRIRLPRIDLPYSATGQGRSTWTRKPDATAAAHRINRMLGLSLDIKYEDARK